MIIIPMATHPYLGHNDDQICCKKGCRGWEKRRLLVSFPKAPGQYKSCSPRKQTTGPSSDRLPALQRDLFLNFHTQECPIASFERRGTTGTFVRSAARRPLPQSPAHTDVPVPHELPTLSPRPPPSSPLPAFPFLSFPRPRPSAGAEQWGNRNRQPTHKRPQSPRAQRRRGGGRGTWGRGLRGRGRGLAGGGGA